MQALTHRSYRHEHLREDTEANERLEFLGDAILHFVAADELYEAFPEAPEGRLTTLRAALVRTESLAAMAEGLGLAGVVRVSRGESTIDGRGRQSILADALEAVFAAVYKDAGLASARAVVRRLIRPRLALTDPLAGNAKGRLQEMIQAVEGVTPFYRVVERSGPVHARSLPWRCWPGSGCWGAGRAWGSARPSSAPPSRPWPGSPRRPIRDRRQTDPR